MYGAIIGDIVGSRFEFSQLRKNKSKEFELFTDDVYFTDDTVLTIATADAILNYLSFTEAYQKWANKYPDAGYGGMFVGWMTSDNPKPYNSFGNGSAMRVSPIAWLYNDMDTVMAKAKESAMVTHNHEEGIKGAMSVAVAIYLARHKTSKKVIREIIELYFGYDLSKTLSEIRPCYSYDVTCQGSVPESIICFLEGESYDDTIRNAISLGGDTDTQACIAGSISEAYYRIPKELKISADKYLDKETMAIVNQFNSHHLIKGE